MYVTGFFSVLLLSGSTITIGSGLSLSFWFIPSESVLILF